MLITHPLECFTTEVIDHKILFLWIKTFTTGKAEEGVLLCRAIIAMANNLQMNLDSNDYSFNDLRKSSALI